MTDTVIREKVVFKWPFFAEEMVHRKDCHKIFIMRNPIWVMSSINKRFNYKPQQDHTLNDYIQTLELFKKYKENPIDGLHLILYEDIFENNFEKLKEILDLMNLKYSNEIFDNSQYNNIINKDRYVHIPTEPYHINQGEFRNWQINQKFENNNFPEKIDILGEEKYNEVYKFQDYDYEYFDKLDEQYEDELEREMKQYEDELNGYKSDISV